MPAAHDRRVTLDQATILLVDDLAPLRETYAAWLTRFGCAVITADNGVSALNLLTTHPVDAVISDIRMPVMDGLELARRFASLQLPTPLLLLSGLDAPDLQTIYALGVEAVLEKPITRPLLVDCLTSSLTPRDQLWLEPCATAPLESLAIKVDSAGGKPHPSHILLGRGGCCFSSPRPLEPNVTLTIDLEYAGSEQPLSGQVVVRWYDPETSFAGVEFLYLTPKTRAWAVPRINETQPRSFIPSPDLSS